MSINKTNGLVFVALLVSFVIAGCTTQTPSPSPTIQPTATITPTATIAPSPSLSAEELKKQCYDKLGEATSASDSRLCAEISCLEERSYCMGVISKDPDQCKNAGSVKDECYSFVAVNTKEIELCDKISSSDRKNFCKANISLDDAYCENLTSSKDSCLMIVARVSGQTDTCNKIGDPVVKSGCLNIVTKSSTSSTG